MRAKVGGPLSSNDGESAVRWAIEGDGILLRSLWDIGPDHAPGRLRRILPAWQSAPADVYALYPSACISRRRCALLLIFLANGLTRNN